MPLPAEEPRRPGSQILVELVKTHTPALAVTVDAQEPSWEWLGTTMVVSPGPLADGRGALVDPGDKELQPLDLG